MKKLEGKELEGIFEDINTNILIGVPAMWELLTQLMQVMYGHREEVKSGCKKGQDSFTYAEKDVKYMIQSVDRFVWDLYNVVNDFKVLELLPKDFKFIGTAELQERGIKRPLF